MNQAGLNHLPTARKTSHEWVACPDGHVQRAPDNATDPGVCAEDGKPRNPVWVDQRRVTWGDQASIASTALIPENGNTDPLVVTRELWNRTVKRSNFHVDVETLEDTDFGWWLYDWLGGRSMIEDLVRRAVNRKNGSNVTGRPSTVTPPTQT